MKSFFDALSNFFNSLHKVVRPYLTMFIATLYNVVLVWAVIASKLEIKDYIASVGPTNAMILGFWFAEKAALKDPKSPEKESTKG